MSDELGPQYPNRITSSRRYGGAVQVNFGSDNDPEAYYVHSIFEEGTENDHASMTSMWAWINHLRPKVWWTPELEDEFIKQVKSYLWK
jgi:hypothetical protein